MKHSTKRLPRAWNKVVEAMRSGLTRVFSGKMPGPPAPLPPPKAIVNGNMPGYFGNSIQYAGFLFHIELLKLTQVGLNNCAQKVVCLRSQGSTKQVEKLLTISKTILIKTGQ